MKIYERPKCEKCNEPAFCLMAGMWVCGRCLAEYDLKNKNRIKEMFLTG